MAQTIGSIDLASLKNLRDDVTQYFWFESNSSSAWGSGAHVTLYPESQFTNPSHANYLKGQNIIMNTDGFSIRNGVLPMMVLDNDSLDFNAVDTTQGTYTTMATFGLTGATIGQTSGAHSVIDADGQRFYASDGTTLLADIGYGAIPAIGQKPYWSLGIRSTNRGQDYSNTRIYSKGDPCMYNGKLYFCLIDMDAPEEWNSSHWRYGLGAWSTVMGQYCIASGTYSYAEGSNTIAIGTNSHGEGAMTTAFGDYSHSEGMSTKAFGKYSHAGGHDTKAYYDNQTVIGKYNDNQSNTAFEIGNGTADTVGYRSNALTVDWYGNVDLPTGKFSGVGETLTYDASHSGTNALEINNASSNVFTVDWSGNVDIASGASYNIGGVAIVDHVIEQGTSGDWTYRKWNSGLAEAWYRANIGTVTLNIQLGTDIVSNVFTIDFPFTFTSVPSCIVGYEGNSTGYAGVQQTNTQMTTTTHTYGIRLVRIGTSSISLSDNIVTVHVVGRWR